MSKISLKQLIRVMNLPSESFTVDLCRIADLLRRCWEALRKKYHDGMDDRLIQYKPKASAVFVSRPHQSAIFSYCTSLAVL